MTASAISARSGDANQLRVKLQNTGNTVALMTKLTLMNASDNTRILPAYLSDNYVSLLPGEMRELTIDYRSPAHAKPEIRLRGWNIAPVTVPVRE